MKYDVYSVRDALVGFGFPVPMDNDAVAVRNFGETHKNVGSPEDFSLWKIGSFDTETGTIVSDLPSMLVQLTDVIRKGEI